MVDSEHELFLTPIRHYANTKQTQDVYRCFNVGQLSTTLEQR